jgi:ketosteroid isomerase-like protein
MAAAHPNATRVRELFAAFRDRDLATIQRAIPDDAVWHFPGRGGKVAGSHHGRDAILAFLMQVPTLSGGTFHAELTDVLANDDRAVALFRGHGERNGKTLDNPTCLVMRLRDGRITEVWEYVWDLYHVDDFWA